MHHLSSGSKNKPSKKACYMLHAGFLLGLFFHPEDGGNLLLQNIGWLSVDYMELCPKRQNPLIKDAVRASDPK
jgi:hypothetical protein